MAFCDFMLQRYYLLSALAIQYFAGASLRHIKKARTFCSRLFFIFQHELSLNGRVFIGSFNISRFIFKIFFKYKESGLKQVIACKCYNV